MKLTPSLFTAFPMDSILQKSECETIAQNIMVILKRTGNEFRNLDWEEYKKERKKDGNFSTMEETFFIRVKYLALGKREDLTDFCKTWNNKYIEELEKIKSV
jgi:hypothetical protein